MGNRSFLLILIFVLLWNKLRLIFIFFNSICIVNLINLFLSISVNLKEIDVIVSNFFYGLLFFFCFLFFCISFINRLSPLTDLEGLDYLAIRHHHGCLFSFFSFLNCKSLRSLHFSRSSFFLSKVLIVFLFILFFCEMKIFFSILAYLKIWFIIFLLLF